MYQILSTTHKVITAVAGGGFDPDDYGTCVLWLKGEDLTGSDGDNITTWTDQSTAGNDFGQDEATKYPIKKTSIVNGETVARFDGNNDFLDSPMNDMFGTVFIVANFTGGTGNQLFMGAKGPLSDGIAEDSYYLYAYIGGNQRMFVKYTTTTRIIEVSSISSQWVIYCYEHDSATGDIELLNDNASQGTTGNDGSPIGISNRTAIGAGYFNESVVDPCGCDIAEVIFYTDVLGSTDRTSVFDYLDTKYAIT